MRAKEPLRAQQTVVEMSSVTASVETRLFDIATELCAAVEVCDRTHLYRTYPECFLGSEAVSALIALGHVDSIEMAEKLGNDLVADGLIRHIVGDHGLENGHLFYNFSLELTNPGLCEPRDGDYSGEARDAAEVVDLSEKLPGFDAAFEIDELVSDEGGSKHSFFEDKFRASDIRNIYDQHVAPRQEKKTISLVEGGPSLFMVSQAQFGVTRRIGKKAERGLGNFDHVRSVWSTLFSRGVLHPRFCLLMKVGALPRPGEQRNTQEQVYLWVLRVMFMVCLLLCSSRFIWQSRPAYYNVYTNMAFVMLHLWLPVGHAGMSSQLQYCNRPTADINLEDDVDRPILQESMAQLVRIYERSIRSAKNDLEDEHGDSSKFIEDCFLEIRKKTLVIANCAFLGIAVVTLIVVFGWMRYDFLGGEYQAGQDRGEAETYWFGWLSGIAFGIIVVPWCCALMSIYGVLSVLCFVLSIRIKCFQHGVENAYEATVDLESRNLIAQEGGADLPSMALIKHESMMFAGTSTSFTHNNRVYAQLQHSAYVLRSELDTAGKSFERIMVSLLLVSMLLIILPIIAIGINPMQDEIHYYLRDLFNVVLGVVAAYLCFVETSSVSDTCADCLTTLLDLRVVGTKRQRALEVGRKDRSHMLPPLKAHSELLQYMLAEPFLSRFGFVMYDVKMDRSHISTFFGVVTTIIFFVVFDLIENIRGRQNINIIIAEIVGNSTQT
jgi:hypothetical protein